jgi:hypothetical protein
MGGDNQLSLTPNIFTSALGQKQTFRLSLDPVEMLKLWHQLVPLLGELPELLSEAEVIRSYLIRLGGAPAPTIVPVGGR